MVSERTPLKDPETGELKEKSALEGLSSAVGKGYYDDPAEPAWKDTVRRELKQRWWLYGVVVFAVVLIGSLVMFKDKLYAGNEGMPVLAVRENASEMCETKCLEDLTKRLGSNNTETVIKDSEEYQECFTGCVKQVAKEIQYERQEFIVEEKKEEEAEKKEEEDEKKEEADERKEEENEEKEEEEKRDQEEEKEEKDDDGKRRL